MENASNALLMAAGVLVGILLVSTIVVSFSGASELAKTYDSKIFTDSLQAFNSNFEKYTTSNTRLQEIITLANFVIDFNSKNEFEKTDSNYIHLIIQNSKGKDEEMDQKTEKQLIEYMKIKGNNFKLSDDGQTEKVGVYQEYICKIIEYHKSTGRVNKIVFEKVK